MFAEKLQAIRSDDDAVSPVIGVILMVAVTVVLAAVIGAFVFGMGDSLNDPAPSAQIDFDYNADVTTDKLVISHDGGETINGDNTGNLAVNGISATMDFGNGDNTVDSGETISAGTPIASYDSTISTGTTVELVWNSPDGGSSQVIGSWTAP